MSKWSDMKVKELIKKYKKLSRSCTLVCSLRGFIQGMHKHPDKQINLYTNNRTPVILFPSDPTIFVKNKAGYTANKQFETGAVCRWAGAVIWWAGAVFWVGRGYYHKFGQFRIVQNFVFRIFGWTFLRTFTTS